MDIIKSFFTLFHKKLDYSIAQNECLLTHMKALVVHPKTFGDYCECHKGKDVALIACGPTLKYAHAVDGMIYVGVNGAFRQSFATLDYLFFQDPVPWLNEANNYAKGHCKKFYGIIPQNRCRDGKFRPISIFDIRDADASTYYLEDMLFHNWPNNIALEPIRDHCGSVFSAMQFIIYTRPKNIYLFGCDCQDGGHYYDDGNGFHHAYGYQISAWQSLKEHASAYYPDINIISVNPIKLKGLFSDCYTREFLSEHPEIEKNTDATILE